jgi:hypothetical protein
MTLSTFSGNAWKNSPSESSRARENANKNYVRLNFDHIVSDWLVALLRLNTGATGATMSA